MKNIEFKIAVWAACSVLALEFGLHRASAALSPEIVLTAPAPKESRPLDASVLKLTQAMEGNIREQLASTMALPATDFQVEIESARYEPLINLTGVNSVQVLGLGSLGGRRLEGLFAFPVMVQMKGPNGLQEQEIRVSGVLKVVGPVIVAKANLPREHVIQKEDLMVSRLPWRNLPNGSFGLSESDLIGRRMKSMLNSGAPFQLALVDDPLAVKSGETVELTVLSGPGVIIRARAVAKQEGKVGDVIRIEQPDTKKILTGLVTGPRTIEVKL